MNQWSVFWWEFSVSLYISLLFVLNREPIHYIDLHAWLYSRPLFKLPARQNQILLDCRYRIQINLKESQDFLEKKKYIVKHTVYPRSSYPFYIVSYNIKWVTTSWKNSLLFFCNKKKLYLKRKAQKLHLASTNRVI